MIEKFILLKNSSDWIGLEFFFKTRIGFGLDNFGSDLNIRQLSDYKRPIRSDAHLSSIVSILKVYYLNDKGVHDFEKRMIISKLL